MTKFLLRVAWGVLASFLGYMIIAGGTTLTFTVWLKETFGSSASPSVIALGTLGAALSGLCGGYIAALLGRQRPLSHAAGVLVFLAIDRRTCSRRCQVGTPYGSTSSAVSS